MASFRDQYTDLFGAYPEYDPIDLEDRAKRRAIDIQAGAPSARPDFGATLDPIGVPPEEQGAIGGLLKTGTAMLGEAGVGALEYASRQLQGNPELETQYRLMGGVTDFLGDVRGDLAEYREGLYARMAPEVMDMKGREFLTLDPEKTIWKGNPLEVGQALMYKLIEQIPMTAATLVPGAVMLRAGSSAKALTYLGASEAGLSVGFIANEIADGINEMDDETLAAEAPVFRQLLQEYDAETARNMFIQEAQGMAPVLGGLLVGAVSATAGRYLEPVLTGTTGRGVLGGAIQPPTSRLQAAGRGAISEGLFQEGPQESIEQIVQNVAARAYDADRPAFEGAGEAFVQGAAIGKGFGATAGALGYRAPGPEPFVGPPDLRPGEPFDEVFGPGGPQGQIDMFDDGMPITEEQVSPDAQAAVSAAIRADGVMDDMVDNINEQAAVEQQMQQGVMPQAPIEEQGELFPTNAPIEGGVPTVVPEQPPAQPEQMTLPMPTERVRGSAGRPVLQESPRGATLPTDQPMPDEADQPTPEPVADINAQLREMQAGNRDGVFVPAGTNMAAVSVPQGSSQVQVNGGVLITKDEATASSVRDRLAAGESSQKVIGAITGAGTGKPVDGRYVVQQRDEQGNVTRETLVRTKAEAVKTKRKFGKGSVILSSEEALARREERISQEPSTVAPGELQEIDARTEDIFAAPDTQVEGELAGDRPPRETVGMAVRLFDENGELIEEELFEDAEAAEARADELATEFPDAHVTMQPLRAGGRRQQKALMETQEQRPRKEQPTTPADEEVAEEVRKALPFEERAEIVGAVAGAETREEAGERAVGAVEEQVGRESQKMIGGFFPPDSLEFADETAAQEYRGAWDMLSEADQTIKGKADIPLAERGTKVSQAQRQKKAALAKLTAVRKAAKPVRKTTKRLKAVAKLAPEKASKVAERIDTLSPPVDEGDISTLDPELTREQVEEADGTDLLNLYEQALATKAQFGRMDPRAIEELRAKVGGTPSLMRKEILRALTTMRNRMATDVRTKSTPVTKKGVVKKGAAAARPEQVIKSEALTATSFKADESKADTIKRKQRAKKAYTALRNNVVKARKFLQRDLDTPVDRDEEGTISLKGRKQLRARQYLQEIIKFGDAINASQSDDRISIEMAESYNKLVEQLKDMSPEKFLNQWSKLAEAQEQMLMQEARSPDTSPGQRAEKAIDSNKKLQAKINRHKRFEEKWQKDSVYMKLVQPIMQKISQGYFTQQGYYIPTLEEAQQLAWAMKEWKRDIPAGYKKDFYNPIKRQLEYVGIEFDENGEMVVEEQDGRFVYTPSDEVAATSAFRDTPSSIDEIQFEDEARDETAEQFNKRRAEERRRREVSEREKEKAAIEDEANQHVSSVNIIQRFRKLVENKKTTINSLINGELAMLEALRQEGSIQYEGTAQATIRIPGLEPFTYRKSAEDLANQRINKTQAKQRMGRIRKVRELKVYADAASASARRPTTSETDYEYELFQELVGVPETREEIQDAASAVGDILENQAGAPLNEILDVMIDRLPQGSFYWNWAVKMRNLNMNEVDIAYDRRGEMSGTTFGKFSPTRNLVLVNRNQLVGLNREGNYDLSTAAVHTILHETIHAATHNAIRENDDVRNIIFALRDEARTAWRDQGRGKFPYGLVKLIGDERNVVPLDEFVAEAFSNPEFQEFLKTVRLTPKMSLWDRFTDVVKKVIGLAESVPDTAFDLLMKMEPTLFERAGERSVRGADMYHLDTMDAPLRKVAGQFWDRMQQVFDSFSRGNLRRGTPLMQLMTMEQMRDTYGDRLPSLKKYVRAFFERNAKNAELMEPAEALSRDWTKLTDKDPEGALEFSRIATEATMNQLAVDKPLTHKANEHVTSDEMKALHKELRKRYLAMDKEWQAHWGKLQKYYKETLRDEAALMLLNALRGVVTQGEGKTLTEATFESKYNRGNILNFNTKEAILAEFGDYLPEQNRDEMATTIVNMANVPSMEKGNYFPLMRYGDYAVYANVKGKEEVFSDNAKAHERAAEARAADPTATVNVFRRDDKTIVRVDTREFVLTETRTQAQVEYDRMIDEYGEGSVEKPQLKFSDQREAAINSNAALGTILSTLSGNTAAQAAIKNFYLRSLADSSFRKREIKRRNRKGVDYDTQHRNFANYSKQSAYYRAQLEFGSRMGEAKRDMNEEKRGHEDALKMSEVVNEIEQRDRMSTDPQEVSSFIRKNIAMTQIWMLTSASYHMINMTQPYMVSLPQMAGRFGWGETLSAMKKARQTVAGPVIQQVKKTKGGFSLMYGDRSKAEEAFNVFEQVIDQIKQQHPDRAPEYIEMLTELRRRHVLEVNPLTELREMATGQTGKGAQMLDATRIMAHLVEVNNRVLTAVAAYDLAVANGDSKDAALEYAGNMVSQTQFNYSSANKPPLFQKYPLLFQFMQWPQHMYALLIQNYRGAVDAGLMNKSEARSALLGLLGTHAAVGGMIGMTLQPIKMAFGLVALAFSDEDDPTTFAQAISGKTFDRMIEQSINDFAGPMASTLVARGIPAALGADVSTRMSMGTLYFVDLKPENSDSLLASVAASFGGATLSQYMNFYDGALQLGRGEFVKGTERFMPKLLRDVLRGGRFMNEGLVNNAGDTVLDTSDIGFTGTALQMIGFTPTGVSQFYAGQTAIKDVERFVRDRRTELMYQYRRAGSGAERARVMQEVAAFNRQYPQERITRSTLLRNVESQRERERRYRRFGANIDERKAPLYEGYGEPYR